MDASPSVKTSPPGEDPGGMIIEGAVMPSAARVRFKVMVVILLIGIASPFLG